MLLKWIYLLKFEVLYICAVLLQNLILIIIMYLNINTIVENYKTLLNLNECQSPFDNSRVKVTHTPGYQRSKRRLGQKPSGVNCHYILVSCTLVPSSLGAGSPGPEFIYFASLLGWSRVSSSCEVLKRGSGLCLFLKPAFKTLMFLVTPLPQLHQFLHLPEVLGFKSGSFLAFLTTNYLELNLLRLPEIFREYSCFSGFKILFLMPLFLFLFNSLKLFVPLCIDYPIIFNGISEGNEY